MPTLIPVRFRDQELTATLIEGVPHVALKPICENIGLQWEAQHKRIKRHPVLSQVACMTHATSKGTDGKIYNVDMLMLPLSYLNGWLFGVDANRVKPAIKDRLIQYQSECYMVLANHFLDAKPKALPKPPPPIKNLYQLSYVEDLRSDPEAKAEVRWWSFAREGGMAAAGSGEQGLRFVAETRELAKNNPKDAEQAITWSLMHIMQGVNRMGICFAELKFCEAIAKAAVAGFRAERGET